MAKSFVHVSATGVVNQSVAVTLTDYDSTLAYKPVSVEEEVLWLNQSAPFALIDWIGESGALSLSTACRLRQHKLDCHILLVVPPECNALQAALQVNISGYLNEDAWIGTELAAAMDALATGRRFWNAELLLLMTSPRKLTHATAYPIALRGRECELWEHLANGLNNQQIIKKMCLSQSSIKNMKNNMAQKLGISNAHYLVAEAVDWGLHNGKLL